MHPTSHVPSRHPRLQWRIVPSVPLPAAGYSSIRAIQAENDFSHGGDVGAHSECDSVYHDNSEHIVVLSTGLHRRVPLREDGPDHFHENGAERDG
ncbi:hypothetical protein SAY86_009032 [Trapa natans]|uniref:Uncharacterized protein n=1 Tax=Trapa natans TaxID=22666 RepID=A0AAN7QC42_TRANT|nr:hypothetical protein SAY86_009032 [Trapa natans]